MGVWNLIAGPIIGIVNKLIPDKAAAAAATAKLQELAAQGALTEELTQLTAITTAQSDVDKVEAASSSVFIAGWRPFIGWTCGAALVLDFVAGPLATWFAALAGHSIAFPQLDMDTLMPLLTGMLGMGTLRTVEKIKGVQHKH